MTKTLTRKHCRRFERRLRGLYTSLSGELDRTEHEYLGTLDEPLEHQADVADAHLEEVGIELVEQEGEAVRAVVEALRRIEAGEYGLCRECELAIPIERLEAIPYAATCVACAPDMLAAP